MASYPTLDYLAAYNLTLQEMSGAKNLMFGKYTPTSPVTNRYDNEAVYYESGDYASLRDLFRINLKEGGTYFFYSSSYFDPFILSVYDNIGRFVAVDDGDTYGNDTIFNFVAPYTGEYYVNASWHQGTASSNKFVYLSIMEDVDTAKPAETTSSKNDYFTGHTGIDSISFGGIRSNYSISLSLASITVNDSTGNDGIDTLVNIERLKFSDYSVAIDVNSMGGHAGDVARIIGAVFGASSVQNKGYVGIGLYYLDKGMNFESLCNIAIAATGKVQNADIVTLLWNNVVGSPISQGEKAYYVGLLENGMSAAELTTLAAHTPLNEANINLVGLAQTGLAYNDFWG